MYEQFLAQAGITSDQAIIYEVLLKNGPLPAGKISQKTPLKRGLIYKVLDQLVEIDLVLKKDTPGMVTLFEPAHPLKLKELAEKREYAAKQAQLALEGNLGYLISDYNLISGKPGIRFFEGLDGIRRVLEDSLTSHTEILTYADIESIQKYIPEINKEYVAKRERLDIKKKGILLDTPFARNFLSGYHRAITDYKLIKYDAVPFQTVMQIYDNKVSYLTLGDKDLIGTIIDDPRIYNMHKYIFEYLWDII